MSFHDEPVVLFYLLVALIVVGYVVSLSLKAAKARKEAAATPEGEAARERPGEDLLLLFVHDGSGKRYGETVAVDEGNLIIKDGQTFYAAPMESFERSGDGVVVRGSIDWDVARKAGETWRERSTKVISYSDEEIPPEDLRED